MEEARLGVESATVERQRAERLLAEKAIPARRLEEATRALALARASLHAAETRLAQQDRTLRSRGAGAEASAFDLRAPIAGTVVSVSATPGVSYEAGAELLRLVRTNPVVVEAQVPASSVGIRAEVAEFALELPGQSELIPLRIVRQAHAPVPDRSTRALLLRFEIDNRNEVPLVGQAGTAWLYAGRRSMATVVPAAALKRGEGSRNGRPAVILGVQKQPGANTIELTRRLDGERDALQREYPGIAIDRRIFRQSDLIETAIHNVVTALRDGGPLVVVVVLLLLAIFRAAPSTMSTCRASREPRST